METGGPCHADVAAALDQNYVAVKLNADYFPSTARQYGVTALPTDLVITPQGQMVERLVGFRPSTEYIAGLNWIANRAKMTNPRVYAQIPGSTPPGAADPGGPPANSSLQAQASPAGSPPVSGFAGPREPDYASRQGSADRAAMAPTGPRADRGDPTSVAAGADVSTSPNFNQGSPPRYGSAAAGTGGSSPSSSMTTAPNWPAYSGAVNPPQSGLQGAPAWRQGGVAIPPSANGVAQNGAPLQPSAAQQPAWQVQSGSPAPTGQTAKPATMYPLALDGFCPVSLREKGRWVPGNRRWGAFHQGRTYLFAGAEEQEQFLKNPEPYAPVLSGNDVVVMVEQRQSVPGQRRFGAWYEDHVYLFSNEAAYQKFYNDASRYATAALQSMRAASNYR